MQANEFVSTLLDLAGEAGTPLSEQQARLCYEHVRLMTEWNMRVNLTRITDFREAIIKHILDSIIPSRLLPRTGLALDVGTGPGFPGVPLKIVNRELHMTLLDSNRKKTSFLTVLLSRLGLEGLAAVQGRWEDFDKIEGHAPSCRYELITMRALRLEVAHLQVLASEALKPNGVFAWWAGPASRPQWERLTSPDHEARLTFQGEFSYNLPTVSAPRLLLIWKKTI